MTTNSSGQIRSLIASNRRRAALPMVALLVTAALGAVGCSSSSNSSELDEYTGTWTLDPDSSTFTLTCPFLPEAIPFNLWTMLTLQEGTLSDLVEVGGSCPTYYDVTSKGTATMASPDPFTGEAPICRIDVSADDTVFQFLEFQFTSWKLTLQAPVKGQAPHGQMIGSANTPLFTVDAAGIPQPDERGDCTYVVHADLLKVAKD